MPVKKRSPKKQSRKKTDSEQVAHYTAVLVEDLKDQFKFVIEKVEGMEERLILRMDERFTKQDERFDIIESVLKEHSRMLQANEGRWNQNEERWNRNEERWKQNDTRLNRIESKLDKVVNKVEQHDQDIFQLKSIASSH